MTIFVDADACPKAIKEILYRAAKRKDRDLLLVANQHLAIPRHPRIKSIQVSKGFDVADQYITQAVKPRDLVITADIPLAHAVIEAGALAINPRGETYTPENIKQRLTMRDFMTSLRDEGIQTGGPAALDNRDLQQFANALDRWLAKN